MRAALIALLLSACSTFEGRTHVCVMVSLGTNDSGQTVVGFHCKAQD